MIGNSFESDVRECLDVKGSILADKFYRKPIDMNLIINLLKKYEKETIINGSMSMVLPQNKSKFKGILIIDDLPNCFAFSNAFQNSQYIVYVTSNENEAFNKLKLKFNEINLVIIDCDVPGLDELETAKKIREFYSLQNIEQIPILAISKYSDDNHKTRYKNAGFSEVYVRQKDINLLFQYVKYFISCDH